MSPYICTPDNPWHKGANKPGQTIEHPDAKLLSERETYRGVEVFECPHCGHCFEMEKQEV